VRAPPPEIPFLIYTIQVIDAKRVDVYLLWLPHTIFLLLHQELDRPSLIAATHDDDDESFPITTMAAGQQQPPSNLSQTIQNDKSEALRNSTTPPCVSRELNNTDVFSPFFVFFQEAFCDISHILGRITIFFCVFSKAPRCRYTQSPSTLGYRKEPPSPH
jgi:hypothetical protein